MMQESEKKVKDSAIDSSSLDGTTCCCYPPKCNSCKRCCSSYCSLITTGLVLLLYLLLGAVVFFAVERPNELRIAEEIKKAREEGIARVTQEVMKSLNLTEEEALNTTNFLISLGKDLAEAVPTEHTLIWDYFNTLFFVSTVVSTIGKCLLYVIS